MVTNRMWKMWIPAFAGMTILLSACAQKAGQDVYKVGEVGKSRAVEFGTVLNVREVQIAPDEEKMGSGALVGAGTSAGAGSYVGSGSGSVWAAVGGALAGAVIGNAIEHEVRSSSGYEYTLEMRDGEIKTIVQEKIDGDRVFEPGDKVMLQYCDSSDLSRKCVPGEAFQRLLPVSKFPSAVSKIKKNKIKHEEE